MHLFALPGNAKFSNKYMMLFILPVIFENLMLGLLGVVDTFMVSSLGEVAVAGVGLVNRIDNFAKQFFIALGMGGSIVLAQYIGAKNKENARRSLENNIIIVTLIGIFVMLVMMIFKSQILRLLYGNAQKDVLEKSFGYFSVTALSYPFTALYYACNAQFRVMGRNKIPFVGSACMMAINLVLKYIFIYVLKMDVEGAALSTLIAMAIVGFVLLFNLKSKKNMIHIPALHSVKFSPKMSWKIMRISVPNGIEQGMFQLGALLIAGLVSGLGTSAIAADQIARNISVFVHCAGSGFASLIMTVVGQCMGARDIDGAKFYTKHILKLDFAFTSCAVIVFLILLKPLVSIFNVSADAKTQAISIMILYSTASAILYPLSFAVPSALRGAGDTRFVMVVASLSMFLFRIGAAYIFVHTFKLGVMGTWVAMVSDWVVRTVIFAVRFKNEKWTYNKVI